MGGVLMNRFWIVVTVILGLSAPAARAEFVSIGSVERVNRSTGAVEFVVANGLLSVYFLSDHVVRFRYTNRPSLPPVPSYAVVPWKHTVPSIEVEEKEGLVEIRTKELLVRVKKTPCRISILDSQGRTLVEDDESLGVTCDEDEVRCFKKLKPGDRFFGLGEKSGSLDRTGKQYTMWNSDMPFYTKGDDPLYVSIPFFIRMNDRKAYGIFLDNTYRSHFNMGASNDRFFWFGAEKGDLDYYFIQGPEIRRVIEGYTELTGRMEMPPLWALGFQQSRWSYASDSTVRQIARQFRDRRIPCDVIYLDIAYLDGYRVFTWDKERFKDPNGLLNALALEGFKVVTIIEPAVKADNTYAVAKEGLAGDHFVKYPDGSPYKGEVWPSWSYFPDFTREKTRRWWGENLSKFLGQGVSGFWNDMNEPAVWGKNMPDVVKFAGNGHGTDHKRIHNVYGLEMARATFDATHSHSQKRHLILTRAGFSGIQRYSAVWTGDNEANVNHLEMACTMPQSMGLSGLPFVGSDVGGFGGAPSPGLYVRWMQLGAFPPLSRAHSALDTPNKEPWALGEEVERLCRKAIELRYRFLPFWYSEFRKASQSGLPIMRPLLVNFQDDEVCDSEEAHKEFMLGDSLLVAPVLSEHDTTKKLYLPAGRWLDWNDHSIVSGPRWSTVEAPRDTIPLFLREGGIIPLQDVQNYVGEKTINQIEWFVFPADRSSYELYQDDGQSYRYQHGEYSVTRVEVEKNAESVSIRLLKPHDRYHAGVKAHLFRLFDMASCRSITLNGVPLPRLGEEPLPDKRTVGFFHDPKKGILTFRTDASLPLTVLVRR